MKNQYAKKVKELLEEQKKITTIEVVNDIIRTIEEEFENCPSSTNYICKDGTDIHTDVGYAYEWFEEYKEVLRKKIFKIKEKSKMDYRERKYYLAQLDYNKHNDIRIDMRNKFIGLRFYSPYNHFRINKKTVKNDGTVLNRFIQMMISIRKEDQEEFEKYISELLKSKGSNYIIGISKDVCGQ